MKATYKRRHSENQLQGFTRTTEGRIPHLRVQCGAVILDAPVKLQQRHDSDSLPRPCRNEDGRYLHVLPGGGIIAGKVA